MKSAIIQNAAILSDPNRPEDLVTLTGKDKETGEVRVVATVNALGLPVLHVEASHYSVLETVGILSETLLRNRIKNGTERLVLERLHAFLAGAYAAAVGPVPYVQPAESKAPVFEVPDEHPAEGGAHIIRHAAGEAPAESEGEAKAEGPAKDAEGRLLYMMPKGRA